MTPGRECHGQHHAEQAAVERHAALPHREDLERMAGVVPGFVEEHVTQTAAENHAEHREEQQVVELRARYRRVAPRDAPQAQPPPRGKTREIHESIPAHRQGADGKRNGIDIRMNQHG